MDTRAALREPAGKCCAPHQPLLAPHCPDRRLQFHPALLEGARAPPSAQGQQDVLLQEEDFLSKPARGTQPGISGAGVLQEDGKALECQQGWPGDGIASPAPPIPENTPPGSQRPGQGAAGSPVPGRALPHTCQGKGRHQRELPREINAATNTSR